MTNRLLNSLSYLTYHNDLPLFEQLCWLPYLIVNCKYLVGAVRFYEAHFKNFL